jgi:catechol 2,3-dioxygenase-like lactoylglutathione lyase family enzyme
VLRGVYGDTSEAVRKGPRRPTDRRQFRQGGTARRSLFLVFLVFIAFSARANEKPTPKILGIIQVRVLTADVGRANAFYYGLLRELVHENLSEAGCDWCERVPNKGQGPVDFGTIKGSEPHNFIASIAFRTDDAEGLRTILKKKLRVGKLAKGPEKTAFSVFDPENHEIIFVQEENDNMLGLMAGLPGAYAPSSSWPHIIHVGLIVKDREAMDKFYRDILGFHVHWQGGMKDGETDWVDMQVPDGTDCIEYMLNVPADADKRTRGFMNHIALGIADVREADTQLMESNLKLPLTEEPKIGKDGKWQLNLYDPDDTRVELMEFTPVEKPCCAEFTGTHPKP